ncbi:MAG: maleylpyruvate isomerase family mycothiol-dependent enzyme [Mycobacteriales bacterium]
MNEDLSSRAVYLAAHASVAALVRPLDAAAADRRVPGCPRWTVHDLVAHLAGNAQATADGTLPEVPPGAEWTQRGVAARRDATIPDLLREWEHSIALIEDLLDDAPAAALDACVHECDLREALGEPSPLDSAYQRAALGYLTRVIGRRITAAGLPTVRVEAGDDHWRLGKGEPTVLVEVGDPHEFYRGLSGRRPLAALRGWNWGSTDPEPYLAYLPLFGPAEE